MYITINKIRYPCTDYAPGDGTAVFYGIEGLELPVAGTVTLCADDGFVLAEQDAGAYTRQIYEGGVLTLTNLPEPEPIPEPAPTPETLTSADVAEALLSMQAEIINIRMGVKE